MAKKGINKSTYLDQLNEHLMKIKLVYQKLTHRCIVTRLVILIKGQCPERLICMKNTIKYRYIFKCSDPELLM